MDLLDSQQRLSKLQSCCSLLRYSDAVKKGFALVAGIVHLQHLETA